MPNQLFAVFARHQKRGDEVCFIVVAKNEEEMGWPLLAHFSAAIMEDYLPLRVQKICDAPGRGSEFIAAFGPERSLPEGAKETAQSG
jgi:hypothetical protein